MSPPGAAWDEGFAACRAAFDAVVAERDRLRQQNHDAAAERDKKQAKMESELAEFRNAYKRAREVTRDFTVDWTTDPPSQQPYGWWRYSSVDMKDTLTALVAERDAALAAGQKLADACDGALDPDPCQHDHNGLCQAHGVCDPCEVKVARNALAAWRAVSGSSEPR